MNTILDRVLEKFTQSTGRGRTQKAVVQPIMLFVESSLAHSEPAMPSFEIFVAHRGLYRNLAVRI